MGCKPSSHGVIENKTITQKNLGDRRSTIATRSPVHASDEVSTDFNANVNKIEPYFQYLLSVRDPEKIFKDEACSEIFHYFKELTYTELLAKCLIAVKPCEKYNFHFILVDLLKHAFPICLEYVMDPDATDNIYQKTVFDYTGYLFGFSWYYAEISTQFMWKFKEAKGIQVLLEYMDSTEFFGRCIKFRTRFEVVRGKRFILKSILHTFHRMTRNALATQAEWEQLGVSNVLRKLYPILNDLSMRMVSSLAWANIISEEEIENFDFDENELNNRIKYVDSFYLDMVVKAIVTGVNLYRIKIHMDDMSEREAAVVVADIENQNYEFNIIDVLEGIYRLSINDKVKVLIYNELKLKSALKDIIIYGNNFEREHATKLLWQLCFNPQILTEVSKDEELFEFMKNLCDQLRNNHENDALRKNLTGLLWMKGNMSAKNRVNVCARVAHKSKRGELKKMKSLKQVVETLGSFDLDGRAQSDELSLEEKAKHIMISYNFESRDLCLRLKRELEKLGHAVWIDVEAISGSSLESMANAVENSKCVLICMTEKYKQSTNCRAEAEYSFNLKKPIVPLIMQSNYVPNGWLGIILGSKIYVDFTRFPFDECIRKVKFEIDGLLGEKTPTSLTTETNAVKSGASSLTTVAESKAVEKWSNKEVQIWLKEKKFNPDLIKALQSFNGALLSQLNSIHRTTPQFVYQILTKNNSDVNLYDMILFVFELEQLFQ